MFCWKVKLSVQDIRFTCRHHIFFPAVKKTTSGFENRRKDELGANYHQYILNQAHKGISPTRRDVFVDDDIRYGYDGPSGSGTSSMLRLDRKPIPATAPLLTTERTHIRVAKRKHGEFSFWLKKPVILDA